MYSSTTSFKIREVYSSDEDTKGGALLSLTMIGNDEGMSSLLRVFGVAELVDTSGDLLSKLVSVSKKLCSEAIVVSSSNLTWMVSIIFVFCGCRSETLLIIHMNR
ncbi:hypothetical protein Tco_1374953 [Tanacetum coccineum]